MNLSANLLNPLPTGNLCDKVVAQIAKLIAEGTFAPGQKLPPEAEIVRQQGVSRTVVREAISRLQAMGLILTRHGIGSFVREDVDSSALTIDIGPSGVAHDLLAIIELRIGIETEAAALAALRHTQADIDAIERALDTLAQETAGGGDGIEPDYKFHLALSRATHNRYFSDILSSLGPGSIPRSRCSIDEREFDPDQYLRRVHTEHEDILSAIRRSDPDAARAAMRNHLSNGRERLRRAAPPNSAQFS
ncbi:MAG: FadR/GntR family transcriptional regulator [Terracidiphilus sp.]|nr:FadR/GntR family transcriptional regulator [Terracidiphilus sp.]